MEQYRYGCFSCHYSSTDIRPNHTKKDLLNKGNMDGIYILTDAIGKRR